MKSHKPLLSSAPPHSILNARTFRYSDSANTDIRRTFARARREAARGQSRPGSATNVLTLILQRK
jgi:hypothetical protein